MQTIQVINDFVLSLQDGTKRAFKRGVHEVEDHIANHWYTKAHSKPAEAAAAPQPDTDPRRQAASEAPVAAEGASEALPPPPPPPPPKAPSKK